MELLADSGKTTIEPQVISIVFRFSRGGESRQKIIFILSRPKNCNEIANESKLNWWTAQKHLQILLKERLIKRCDFGRIKFYALTSAGEQALAMLNSGELNETKAGDNKVPTV